QGLDEVFRADDEVLVRLRPLAAVGDLVMPPALLDAALQASFFLLMGESGTEIRLPFALAELDLYRPGATPAWAWLRRAGKAEQVDIDLCDEHGEVCIRITGLSFRVLRGAMPLPVQQEGPDGPAPTPRTVPVRLSRQVVALHSSTAQALLLEP